MPQYRIRLVEEMVITESHDFLVETGAPGDAAGLLIRSRDAGVENDDTIVAIKSEAASTPAARTRVFCRLLDDSGAEIGEIEPSDPRLRIGTPPRSLSERSVYPGQPRWIFDPKEEFTYAWHDRDELARTVGLAVGACRKFTPLVEDPPIYAAHVPKVFAGDGSILETEIRWFQSRAAAETAVILAFGQSPDPDDAAPTASPWGTIEALRFIARGIYQVATPSHGGLKLSRRLNAGMPDDMRSNDGFYEEDCRWSFVALRYPEHFQNALSPDHPGKTAYDHALGIAGHFYPEILARFLSETDKKRRSEDTPSATSPRHAGPAQRA